MKIDTEMLEDLAKAIVSLAKRTGRPAGVYFDAEGRFWYANKHWTAKELVEELRGEVNDK